MDQNRPLSQQRNQSIKISPCGITEWNGTWWWKLIDFIDSYRKCRYKRIFKRTRKQSSLPVRISLIPFSCLYKRTELAQKATNKKLKMNLKILAVALSMVAAQSNNPGVHLSGSAEKMHTDYEKMPVDWRFWVSSKIRRFYFWLLKPESKSINIFQNASNAFWYIF